MDPSIISYLLTQGGPVVRWRTATELPLGDITVDRDELFAELLACPEVRHWLNLLGAGPVHHSKDSSFENALAKLCEYGLRAGLPELDERVLPYCAVDEGGRYHDDALILVPFLVRAGYADEPRVADWMARRIDVLYELARLGDCDLYMDEPERRCLPASQRELHGRPKPFYRQRFNHHWGVLKLPSCYDLCALAYFTKPSSSTDPRIEAIVSYLLQPAFQETPGGYIWNPKLRRAYAAGRVFLACLPRESERPKLVLFLEMMAQFEAGRASAWFRQGMAHLETFCTARGTYCFPREYLSEKTGYYLYAGMHMGLAESPRNAHTLELESTFRMARLKELSF
jgi:hypothetical protein